MSSTPRTHRLKTHPEPFTAALEGHKRHSIRRDDRGYQAGELVVKAEWDPFARAFTGREAGPFVITGITRNGPACTGLLDGYVVLGLAPFDAEEDQVVSLISLLGVIFELRVVLEGREEAGKVMLFDLPKLAEQQLRGRRELGQLLHDLAARLGVPEAFGGGMTGEAVLRAVEELKALAGPDARGRTPFYGPPSSAPTCDPSHLTSRHQDTILRTYKEEHMTKTIDKLAEKADQLYTIREARLAMQKQVDELQKSESALREELIAAISKSDATGVAGRLVRVTVVTKPKATLKDWDELIAYCRRRNAWDLIQHRISETAVAERWNDGKEIPGIEAFNVVTLSMNKV